MSGGVKAEELAIHMEIQVNGCQLLANPVVKAQTMLEKVSSALTCKFCEMYWWVIKSTNHDE